MTNGNTSTHCRTCREGPCRPSQLGTLWAKDVENGEWGMHTWNEETLESFIDRVFDEGLTYFSRVESDCRHFLHMTPRCGRV